MIFADSKLLGVIPSPIPSARAVDGLSESTGADIVVSDKSFPPIGDLVKKHAAGNSVFISLTEFPDGKTESALRKLIELEVRSKQLVVLGGVVDAGGDQAWHKDSYRGSYRAYVERVAHFISAGACVVNISSDYLDTYALAIEANIGKDEMFVPSELKQYVPLNDGSLTLATVPAVRSNLAKMIYDDQRAKGRKPNLIDVIALYTNKRMASANLYSESICDGMRSWFGIPDGWNISLTQEDEED